MALEFPLADENENIFAEQVKNLSSGKTLNLRAMK